MEAPKSLAEKQQEAEWARRMKEQTDRDNAAVDWNGAPRTITVDVQAVSRDTGDPHTSYFGFGCIGRYFVSTQDYTIKVSPWELDQLREARAFLMVKVVKEDAPPPTAKGQAQEARR
jgi:hypothetical protein